VFEEGGEEVSAEVLADILDPTKIRGHATFGVKAKFQEYGSNSRLKFKVSFYIRTAPQVEFRRVEVIAKVEGLSRLIVSLNVYEGQSLLYSKQYSRLYQPLRRAIVAFGRREVVEDAARSLESALYAGADIILDPFTDAQTESALSTLQQTASGQTFRFLPPIQRRPHALYAESSGYYAVQNFLLEIATHAEADAVEASFVLRYIAPSLVDRQRSRVVRLGEYGFPNYVFIDNRANRWSIQNLFEVEGALKWANASPAWNWIRVQQNRQFAGLFNLTPIGCLAVGDNSCSNCILLRDWHIHVEEIFPLELSNRSIRQSFDSAVEEAISRAGATGIRIDEQALRDAASIVLTALQRAFIDSQGRPRVAELYKFQEESLIEGLSALILGEHRVLVLQARTAGGKTLAFLLPLLIYTVYLKLVSADAPGVKALLFYPTTALQNDQAATIFQLLWYANQALQQQHMNVVTLGMLHGYTPKRVRSGGQPHTELRLRCPICGARLVISWTPVQGVAGLRTEELLCSNSQCTINSPSSPEHDLLRRTLRVTREAIYSDPPDVLIANPDIINARLTLAGREDPDALTVIGKRAYVCERCGTPHDITGRPRKCRECNYNSLKRVSPTHPRIIVVDEAHLLRGGFGTQVSHVLTRLEQAIRQIHRLPDSWRPVYFISSATLNNPRKRAEELTASDSANIVEISAKQIEQEQPTNRVHVFIMPKLYSPEATSTRIIEALYADASALEARYKATYNSMLNQLKRLLFSGGGTPTPASLIFVNRISEANELVGHIRSLVPRIRANGHTTDYNYDKVRVEDEFSRGDLDAIVATKGLEVGVDFDRVDVGVIYGMPFYISDYTQRIGRIGRRQHSMIYNIFMPDKPIDHFYYRNWRLLSDGALRDVHMRSEAYRIERENPEALRRAGQRIVLDMMSIESGSGRVISSSIRQHGQQVAAFLQRIFNNLSSYVSLALRTSSSGASNIALQSAQDFLSLIQRNVNIHLNIRRAISSGLERTLRQLRNLRSLEAEAEYDFVPIPDPDVRSRPRGMLYAFRHAMQGQVISYRGSYFTVIDCRGDSLGVYPSTSTSQNGG